MNLNRQGVKFLLSAPRGSDEMQAHGNLCAELELLAQASETPVSCTGHSRQNMSTLASSLGTEPHYSCAGLLGKPQFCGWNGRAPSKVEKFTSIDAHTEE